MSSVILKFQKKKDNLHYADVGEMFYVPHTAQH